MKEQDVIFLLKGGLVLAIIVAVYLLLKWIFTASVKASNSLALSLSGIPGVGAFFGIAPPGAAASVADTTVLSPPSQDYLDELEANAVPATTVNSNGN